MSDNLIDRHDLLLTPNGQGHVGSVQFVLVDGSMRLLNGQFGNLLFAEGRAGGSLLTLASGYRDGVASVVDDF